MKQIPLLLGLVSVMASASVVDINHADELALATALSGVGPTLAKRIVEFRTSQGHFPTPDSIQLVPGVGEKLYLRNRDFIAVSIPPSGDLDVQGSMVQSLPD